jgi:hypothetical protein
MYVVFLFMHTRLCVESTQQDRQKDDSAQIDTHQPSQFQICTLSAESGVVLSRLFLPGVRTVSVAVPNEHDQMAMACTGSSSELLICRMSDCTLLYRFANKSLSQPRALLFRGSRLVVPSTDGLYRCYVDGSPTGYFEVGGDMCVCVCVCVCVGRCRCRCRCVCACACVCACGCICVYACLPFGLNLCIWPFVCLRVSLVYVDSSALVVVKLRVVVLVHPRPTAAEDHS